MTVKEMFLDNNKYSRPGLFLESVKAIVMHWTANPEANAIQNRNFFNNRKDGKSGYGSAHYIIDQDGTVIHCIPDNEVAYHCGTSVNDPVSGKVYTDYAREKFGLKYTTGAFTPNYVTIGIELCPLNNNGDFAYATYLAAVDLCKTLCIKYNLTSQDITTHYAIVGWKNCPKKWVDYPEQFDMFVKDVAVALGEIKDESDFALEEPEEKPPVVEVKKESFIDLIISFIRSIICGKR